MSLRACKVPRIKVFIILDVKHVKKVRKFDPHWFDISVPNVFYTPHLFADFMCTYKIPDLVILAEKPSADFGWDVKTW